MWIEILLAAFQQLVGISVVAVIALFSALKTLPETRRRKMS